MSKRELGQYYTTSNPFSHPLFIEWMALGYHQGTILEPFAGANNILKLVAEAGYEVPWACYDIDPPKTNNYPKFDVVQRDTIADFPVGYDVCITNCPYLGKSSAMRRHIDYPWVEDDLYKVCLRVMLQNCRFVAAIIPESFITAGIHLDRLWGVISLTFKMFDDTDCPVCLAMFSPREMVTGTRIYSGYDYIGTLEELQDCPITASTSDVKWVFNDKAGSIGVKTVDNQRTDDCKFFEGELINPDLIKISSRSFTRISGLPKDIDREKFLAECNKVLAEYRNQTKDVMMTSFKGLRKDGKYRRRLDFKTVKSIMDNVMEKMGYSNKLF